MQYVLSFPEGNVLYDFRNVFDKLSEWKAVHHFIFVTDNHIAGLYPTLFEGSPTIVIAAGENNKEWETVSYIVQQLAHFEAHRKSLLIAIGGGVVTDIAGFAASVYMRGIPFGFVPTSLLGMVDASIGGKNGINYQLQKNLLGIIRQPQFILFDQQLLHTLSQQEWSNGFAEIIKYACLFDKALYKELEEKDLYSFQQNDIMLSTLIEKCVAMKNKIVLEDEKENGARKLLNFGHTAGHAIERLYHLPHGYAVGIGMLIACRLSQKITGLAEDIIVSLAQLLKQYNLPVHITFKVAEVMEVLKMDKKRHSNTVDYILLNNIGEAIIKPLPFSIIEETLTAFAHESHH